MAIERTALFVGLAWLILNRYEATLVGYQLGVIPEVEWAVWTARLEQDLQLPFIRDVWDQDVSNFDYTRGFKELVTRLLSPADGPGSGPWPVDGRGAPSGAYGRLSRPCTPSSSPTT
ncbi:MAG TPA: hypothetical protein VFO47_04085 [Actinomycetes bacterium]|nr:hypothetical protein [Actinomycetes bacterium]